MGGEVEPGGIDPGRIRVGVLFGGRSGEHPVSLMSARTVLAGLREAGFPTVPIGITVEGAWLVEDDPLARLEEALQAPEPALRPLSRARPLWALLADTEAMPPVDVVFPVLHGPFGEDGTVQGLLEMAGVPYVGCGVLASAVAMDKAVSKALFARAGIPQTRYRVVMRRRWQEAPRAVMAELESELGYPLFVKPANLGSSVGVSKVRERSELGPALDLAGAYDRKLVVEQAIPDAREIEVSILGNDNPVASVPGEVIPANEFYDYEAKYLRDDSVLRIPAPLEPQEVTTVQQWAIRAFRALDGSGLARVDFLLSPQGGLYLNEVNTMPGFTQASMYPKLWEAQGLSLAHLVRRLVVLALERHRERGRNRIQRG